MPSFQMTHHSNPCPPDVDSPAGTTHRHPAGKGAILWTRQVGSPIVEGTRGLQAGRGVWTEDF